MSAEGWVRRELRNSIDDAIDKAILAGSGEGGQPLGLDNTPGIQAQAFASAANPTDCASTASPRLILCAVNAPFDEVLGAVGHADAGGVCLPVGRDEVDPRSLRACYRRLFAAPRRGKGLEGFACLDGHYLLSVDGTGHHSSKKVHCPNCCGKHHRDGTTTYYHMMLGAVLVHPEEREVFPLAPEPIAKSDGSRKNDCEAQAR